MNALRHPPAFSGRSRGLPLWNVLLSLALMFYSVFAHAQAEVSAVPRSFSSGASIKVVAEGLSTSSNYRLRLEQQRPGVQAFDLLDFSSGDSSSSVRQVSIPNAPNGPYDLVLYRVQLGTTRVASVPVTLGPSPSLGLSPPQGAPGRRIVITVNNLKAGSLRVSYAGRRILGPVAVGDGTFTGHFVVPADLPASLPATVPVVAENLVGRLVVGRGSVNFQAQAPSGAPRLGLLQPVVPSNQLSPLAPFTFRGRLADNAGRTPGGTQSLYFRGGGVTIPLDTDASLSTSGELTLQARAPDQFLDGLATVADRPGTLLLVNQGRDPDTDARRDGPYQTQGSLGVVIDGNDRPSSTFSIVVRRPQSQGGQPVQGVIVEAAPDYQSAFLLPTPEPGAQPASDYQLHMSASINQLRQVRVLNQPRPIPENYGCPVTLYRRITGSEGRATFTIAANDILQVNVVNTLERYGSCPIAPCNSAPDALQGMGGNSLVSFVMDIAAAHLGYRSTAIAVSYNPDTGEFFNVTTNQPFTNNSTEVVLEPSAQSDFDLRTMTIDGLGGPTKKPPLECPNSPSGICYYEPFRFSRMFTYPASPATRWPDSAFEARNVGRKVRLLIDPAVYGPLSFGRIRIGNTAWANFAAAPGTPVCLLDVSSQVAAEKVEYVATLPDLTRLAAGAISGTVELRFGSGAPLRTFPITLYTDLPEVDLANPNVATLRINALTDRLHGTYNIPGADIPVDSPGHGVGRMDSSTVNDGDFDLRRSADGALISKLMSVTDNEVAANPGGAKSVTGAFFGFADPINTQPAPVELFNTGLIPLFAYTWGVPPIADATLGADFWMRSDLRNYGELRPAGMNATIDPRLAGGVDLYFDLDLVFGLVSGSMRAESEIGIAMRGRINQGGLAHLSGNPSPAPGECFTFDLDGVWEACAVGICEGGRENLIAVREPSGCANSLADDLPLMLRRQFGLSALEDPQSTTNFDLQRPRHTATALGGDGRGHAITLGVNDAGDLLATHITGGATEATRVIASRLVGVQHLDIAFHASNKAVAVWSESLLTQAQVTSLMQSQRGRAFDDLARNQRLRYAVWDGRQWSSPAALTSIGSDGKPQLAACVQNPNSILAVCPLNGEITAVWERDANRNLDAPDIEVWSAQWRPGSGWNTPQRVSSIGTSSDMLPSVAYRAGIAVVAWARNPNGAFADLNARQVAYRFLDGSPQRVATALGSAVGWVDIGVANNNDLVIAYTRAQDPNGFVGNRQALSVARSSSCSSGACTFRVTEPRDPKGRQFRVERPRVNFDENGTPLIGFRAVAFGPDAQGRHALPGDLPGIVLGTGELAMLRVQSFTQATHTAQIVGLSGNGLLHWKPEFLFDETLGGVLATSMEATAPVGLREPMEFAKQLSPKGASTATPSLALSDGATLRLGRTGPDFELRDASLSRTVVSTGQGLSLSFNLVNVGSNYASGEHGPVKVVASLNGPAGAGAALGTFTLGSSLAGNANQVVVLPLTLPAGVNSDERQTVFVDIVADTEANSVDSSADHEQLEINVMPVPTLLNASSRANVPFVNLVWRDPADSRVAGWRIWKLDAQGNWKHLGSTRVPGYVDFTATIGTTMRYRIASYSANGMESEPSEPISAHIEMRRGNGLFANGFEASP
jgi:hypothetical protein